MLMTAANLVCGFASVLCLVSASPLDSSVPEKVFFGWAIAFLIVAAVFDFLDGKLARFCGQESNFGRELDSLADLVSFGLAPALLGYRVLLQDFLVVGPALCAAYFVSSALRLARFNSMDGAIAKPKKNTSYGLPVPFAAGLITTFTWFTLSLTADGRAASWKWLLVPVMVFVSLMMLSRFTYPSSARLRNWAFLAIVLLIAGWNNQWLAPLMIFVAGLVYAAISPFLSFKPRDAVPEEKELY